MQQGKILRNGWMISYKASESTHPTTKSPTTQVPWSSNLNLKGRLTPSTRMKNPSRAIPLPTNLTRKHNIQTHQAENDINLLPRLAGNLGLRGNASRGKEHTRQHTTPKKLHWIHLPPRMRMRRTCEIRRTYDPRQRVTSTITAAPKSAADLDRAGGGRRCTRGLPLTIMTGGPLSLTHH